MVAARNPLTVQTAATVDDGSGGQSVTWADTYTLWPVEIKGLGGAEEDRTGRLITIERWRFKIRFGPTVTTSNRALFAGKTMNIRSVQDRDGRRKYLWLECEVGDG